MAQPTSKKQALLKKLASQYYSGSHLVAKTLKQIGITHVFAIAGTPVDEILSQCSRLDIRIIGHRNQQGATLASASFNYMSGRLASVVIVSAGPAVTNCATGLLVSQDNKWPVLVIGGRRSVSHHASGNFQQLNGKQLYQSICKASYRIDTPDNISDGISQAYEKCTTIPFGTSYVDITEDALFGKARLKPTTIPSPTSTSEETNHNIQIDSAAELFINAKHPSILIGPDIRWSANWNSLKSFVELFQIPFSLTSLSRGFLPDNHDLCFSPIRSEMLAQSDAVIVAGVQFDWVIRFGCEIPQDVNIIFLHHAPPNIDRQNILEIIDDPGKNLNCLVDSIQLRTLKTSYSNEAKTDWVSTLKAKLSEHQKKIIHYCEEQARNPTAFNSMAVLKDHIPADAITIFDGNVSMQAAQAMLPALSPLSRLNAGHNGCMGVGIPFAIGSHLATGKTIIVVTGDLGRSLSSTHCRSCAKERGLRSFSEDEIGL